MQWVEGEVLTDTPNINHFLNSDFFLPDCSRKKLLDHIFEKSFIIIS